MELPRICYIVYAIETVHQVRLKAFTLVDTTTLLPAILDFGLPVMSGIIRNSPIELLDTTNVGAAVEFALLSHIQTEI